MVQYPDKQLITARNNVASCRKWVFFTIFLFIIQLSLLNSADKQCVWSGVENIVAVADIHGDYDRFVILLKGTGLIDDKLQWSGGKTHLVQTGDIMDRGTDARKVLDLLIRLEEEAKAAGGWVHVLLGNHEEANLLGVAFDRTDYVTPEQFVDFLPDKYRDKEENQIRQNAAGNSESSFNLEEELKRFWAAKIRNDRKARDQYNRNFRKLYGKWLMSKNVVIKINDIVFVHGGISEGFSSWALDKINMRAIFELKALMRGEGINLLITYQSNGPLWYRGLINNDEEEYKEEVDRILKNLQANYMVVGHTVRNDSNPVKLSRFDGKIWGLDTGMSEYYGGYMVALIIEKGDFSVWEAGK